MKDWYSGEVRALNTCTSRRPRLGISFWRDMTRTLSSTSKLCYVYHRCPGPPTCPKAIGKKPSLESESQSQYQVTMGLSLVSTPCHACLRASLRRTMLQGIGHQQTRTKKMLARDVNHNVTIIWRGSRHGPPRESRATSSDYGSKYEC